MPVPIPDHEGRSAEQLRQQFEVERELAQRLRSAPASARPDLYTSAYEELFTRVPHLPQLAQKVDPAARQTLISLQRRLVLPFLDPTSVFLEVGSGDCSLALDLAPRVAQVIAVEASPTIVDGLEPPPNFQLLVNPAPPFELPGGCADLVFSSHFLEHLHPDDARGHCLEAHRLLRTGGRILCVTPNRIYGPHDVSRYFAETACGLHLKEYTHGELTALLREAGFRHLARVRGIGGAPELRSWRTAAAAEWLVSALPAGLRRFLLELHCRWRGGKAPFRPLEQVIVTGTK